MRIGILGTGSVGRTLGSGTVASGHEVTIGTRDPEELMGRSSLDPSSGPTFAEWHSGNTDVRVGTFAEAAAYAELVINATAGVASLDALRAAGEENLDGKILVDVSNPLDFSAGMPPSLSVCNTDSLGEQIQTSFPGARVVKTLNTVNASIMVQPDLVAGPHAMFISGDDGTAKEEVTSFLKESFGWKQVIDLGDITAARAQEMYLPLWLRLMGALGDARFNISIAR